MSIKPIDTAESHEPDWQRTVRLAVGALRYGSVEIVVHDGRVVQVERRERVRFADERHRTPDSRRREIFHEGRADRTTGAEGIGESRGDGDEARSATGRGSFDD